MRDGEERDGGGEGERGREERETGAGRERDIEI